jgi:hypothetical protein
MCPSATVVHPRISLAGLMHLGVVTHGWSVYRRPAISTSVVEASSMPHMCSALLTAAQTWGMALATKQSLAIGKSRQTTSWTAALASRPGLSRLLTCTRVTTQPARQTTSVSSHWPRLWWQALWSLSWLQHVLRMAHAPVSLAGVRLQLAGAALTSSRRSTFQS